MAPLRSLAGRHDGLFAHQPVLLASRRLHAAALLAARHAPPQDGQAPHGRPPVPARRRPVADRGVPWRPTDGRRLGEEPPSASPGGDPDPAAREGFVEEPVRRCLQCLRVTGDLGVLSAGSQSADRSSNHSGQDADDGHDRQQLYQREPALGQVKSFKCLDKINTSYFESK